MPVRGSSKRTTETKEGEYRGHERQAGGGFWNRLGAADLVDDVLIVAIAIRWQIPRQNVIADHIVGAPDVADDLEGHESVESELIERRIGEAAGIGLKPENEAALRQRNDAGGNGGTIAAHAGRHE